MFDPMNITRCIFLLAVEPLSVYIKNNVSIKGIKFKKYEYKIGQYADDTFLLLNGSEESINNAFLALEQFSSVSGLRVNIDKTQAIWLGRRSGETTIISPNLPLKWVKEFTLLGITLSANLKHAVNINYLRAVDKIRSVLKLHSRRKLTLMGKVTIIKSLAIPQIVHILSVLPSPRKEVIKELYDVLKEFLWDGKRPKLTWEKLTLGYEKGGLKLTNIEIFFKSLNISWIKRIQNTGAWQSLFEETICGDRLLVWELDKQSLEQLCKNTKNLFWKEVLKDWVQYKYSYTDTNESVIDLVNYPIWNSSWNLSPNLNIMKKEFLSKDIVYIKNLLNPQGFFYTHVAFIQRYGMRINFLDYSSLINSIPRHWKQVIAQKDMTDLGKNIFINHAQLIQRTCRPTKYVYKNIMDKMTIERPSEQKWQAVSSRYLDWKTIYLMPSVSTMDMKLQECQFKIIHRILPTNKFLYLCNLSDTDQCYFCNSKVETISHLLFECDVVKSFWTDIFDWLYPMLDLLPLLNLENVIFGVENGEHSNLINQILLIVKRLIFVTKCKSENLSLPLFTGILKSCYSIEQNIYNSSELDPSRNSKFKYVKYKWKIIESKLKRV